LELPFPAVAWACDSLRSADDVVRIFVDVAEWRVDQGELVNGISKFLGQEQERSGGHGCFAGWIDRERFSALFLCFVGETLLNMSPLIRYSCCCAALGSRYACDISWLRPKSYSYKAMVCML